MRDKARATGNTYIGVSGVYAAKDPLDGSKRPFTRKGIFEPKTKILLGTYVRLTVC
jgi:hypothetical protein